ncbi:hypothetical protein ACA910_007181 [Epithemia clementina (nom. ined.)]
MINGKQHTVTWHVDDLKSSHVDPKVNNEFAIWFEHKYGDPKVGKVKAERGKRHNYLAMTLDYFIPGEVKIDMTEYVKNMVDDFPEELEDRTSTPWNEQLFKVNEKSKALDKTRAEQFHTFVAKEIFFTKRARPDIYAVHPDIKSHTGALIALEKVSIEGTSKKQKVYTRSSTEAKIISTDNMISQVLWSRLFMEAQGYPIGENIIRRDNMSSMKLEANGKAS